MRLQLIGELRCVRISLWAAMVFLAIFGTDPASASTPCEITEVADLPADFSSGVPVVEVGVNGQKARFHLSTASSPLVMDEALARRFGLAVNGGRSTVYTESGKHIADTTKVDEFTIGNLVSRSTEFLLAEGGSDGSDGSAVGMVGRFLLNNYDLEIDPARDRIHLFKPIKCESGTYWWDDHFELPLSVDRYFMPVVHVVAEGRELTAGINTARAYSTIDASTLGRLFPESAAILENSPQDSNSDVHEYTFREMAFGPITIKNFKIRVLNYKAFSRSTDSHIPESLAEGSPIKIGMDLLGRFHSMISFEARKIEFTMPGERKPSPLGVRLPGSAQQ